MIAKRVDETKKTKKSMDWVNDLPPELRQDILDTEAGRNIVGPFHSVEELFREVERRYGEPSETQ